MICFVTDAGGSRKSAGPHHGTALLANALALTLIRYESHDTTLIKTHQHTDFGNLFYTF